MTTAWSAPPALDFWSDPVALFAMRQEAGNGTICEVGGSRAAAMFEPDRYGWVAHGQDEYPAVGAYLFVGSLSGLDAKEIERALAPTEGRGRAIILDDTGRSPADFIDAGRALRGRFGRPTCHYKAIVATSTHSLLVLSWS